ncbi:hypothetical protein HYH02_013246 [Chlamydomonas schloesseri]|uniref:Endoplasmic reticulum resident protein 29 C-terminal domain-containing protein n=1 Tax=Chlamydomonas schloesseri TaxID=2026947 RepID=A0A835VZR3_9CHLO|nr:hypothetical protein HYH02_013246 [Chlamydomonas schloesseri]|eukprot:KAG2431669.1 hypothetical protein HYH02_013246 [Chlamydomonas schloesseri]
MARTLGLVSVLALAACAALSHAIPDQGIVYLDDYTFDKVVDGSRDVLVRFDKEYAWGEEHDAFKEVAKKVGEAATSVLVASVPVAKRDFEPKNVQLAERYGVADEGKFPLYFIFRKDAAEPVRYTGSATKINDMLAWLAQKTGAFFGLKGQVKELDALARELVAAEDAAGRKAVLSKAESLLGELAAEQQEAAKYYVKVMGKAVDAPGFPTSESKRLSGLVGGKMSEDKRAAMQLKLNVLASFAGSGSGSAAKSDKVDLDL